MKMILKTAIAVAALSGAAALLPNTAMAGVDVSVGVRLPGVTVGIGPGYVPYDDQYYYEPIYYGGAWYHGPYRWRMDHGQRMFYVNGGWRRDEWRGGARPSTIVFRNGGSFRNGRNSGFGDADRINARYRSGNSDVRDDKREMKDDRQEMREDRRDLHDDKKDRRDDKRDRNHH